MSDDFVDPNKAKDKEAGRNGSHKYTLTVNPGPKLKKDGTPYAQQPKPKYKVPSVTTINNQLEKGGLVWSAARIAAEMAVLHPQRWKELPPEEAIQCIKVEHQRQWKIKAACGTIVHEAAMAWASGEVYDVDPAIERHIGGSALTEEAEIIHAKIHGSLNALTRFYHDEEPQWLAIEQTIVHPGFNVPLLDADFNEFHHGDVFGYDESTAYMGGFDAVGTLKSVPSGALIDIKTGSKYPAEVTLQLSAYAAAPYIATFDSDGFLHTLKRFRAPRYRAALYLHEDGTYDISRFPAGKEAFAHFKYLRRLHKWKASMNNWEKSQKAAKITAATTEGELPNE